MTRPFRSLVILLMSALLSGGCGGATKKVDPAADLALAKTAVLTAADLPGYSEKPHQESSDIPDSVKNDFAKCLNVDATFFDDTPGAQKANSSDFEKAARPSPAPLRSIPRGATSTTVGISSRVLVPSGVCSGCSTPQSSSKHRAAPRSVPRR